ncbi:MAG: hypothetical protein KF901_19175 [Myxococcales bacterium]|nr:hypothetical protein [Myxococcales bacterium]
MPVVGDTVPHLGLDNVGHGFGVHVGADPLHVPEAWHVRSKVDPPVLSV